MKPIRKRTIPALTTAIIFVTVLIFLMPVLASAEAPVKARITFLTPTFSLDNPNEQINLTITLENPNALNPVYTQAGFSALPFNLHLYFKGPGPDGGLITASTGVGDSSPTPSVPPVKVKTERLEEGWIVNMPIAEVREYYQLIDPGKYEVWLEIPFVQYDPEQVVLADCDNDGILDECVPYDAVLWGDTIQSYDEALGTGPATITLTTEAPTVTSDIRVVGSILSFDKGSKPPMVKQPLQGIEVRLYKISDIELFGITRISYKTYADIITNSNIPFLTAHETLVLGEYLFESVEQDAYVIIGVGNAGNDYNHVGSQAMIDAGDPLWGVGDFEEELILITDMKGRKSPGKKTIIKGSKLSIVQPQYVEWQESTAFYPIGLLSEGNWDVEISIKPPKGFDIDQKELKETLSSDSRALQFILMDNGGEFVPFKVNYKVKHKKIKKEFEDEIGIKLSKKLAKKKDLTIWGEKIKKDK